MKDYYSFACTHLGFSHLSSKKPCQDYSMHMTGDDWSVAIVSDGHGSANFTRSDRGSRFACEATRDALQEFLREVNPEDLRNPATRDGIVIQLCKNILLRWNTRVDADVSDNPFTPEEVEKVADKYKNRYLNGDAVEHAYGATLIVAIVTKDFFLAIRNGDGQCVAADREGVFTTPIPWNDNCEFNVTTSLCDHEAIDNFRYCYSTELPAAVFVGSDGVDDSYTSVEELFHLYRSLCLRALDEGVETTEEYVAMLLPEITRRGSTDDVSISGLINVQMLQGARTAMEYAREQRQLRLAEEKRQQQRRILERDIKIAQKKRQKAQEQIRLVQEKIRRLNVDRSGYQKKLSQYMERLDAFDRDEPTLQESEAYYEGVIREADQKIQQLFLQQQELQSQSVRKPANGFFDAEYEPVRQDPAIAALKALWQELQRTMEALKKSLTKAQDELLGTQTRIRKIRFDRMNIRDEIAQLRGKLNAFAAEESNLLQEEAKFAGEIRTADQELQRLADRLQELQDQTLAAAAQEPAAAQTAPEETAAAEPETSPAAEEPPEAEPSGEPEPDTSVEAEAVSEPESPAEPEETAADPE